MRVSLVCVLLFAVAMARGEGGSGGLASFDSEWYEVRTDMPRREAAKLARHMDSVFDEYSDRMSAFEQKFDVPVRLYLMRSKGSYMRMLDERDIDGSNTAGMAFGDTDAIGLAAWSEGQGRASLLSTLQHEGFHQFAVLRFGGGLPTWANEGLAEYFGHALLVRGKLKIGIVPEDELIAVQSMIESGRHLPFRELLKMSHEEWNRRVAAGGERAWLQYAQSWSVVQFLVHGERGKYADAFVAYLRLVAEGRDEGLAFEEAFGSREYEPFEKAWIGYTKGLVPDPLSVATRRLQFLAIGIGVLHEEGKLPRTIEEIRDALRERGFVVRNGSHGVEREYSAEEDRWFVAPVSGGKRARKTELRMIEDRRDKGAPIGIEVRGLRARVRLEWTEAEEGGYAWDIVVK